MDFDALVEELANRVKIALAEREAAQKADQQPTTCSTTGFCYADTPESQKPVLLGLTQDSPLPPCRFTLLESARVKRSIASNVRRNATMMWISPSAKPWCSMI